MVFFFISILLFILYRTSDNNQATQQDNPKTATDKPVIGVGNTTINVEIARTPEDIRQGLSLKEKLAENEGMLFDIPYKNSRPTFWMKDMLISLDIIWIKDDKIVSIHENLPPSPKNVPDESKERYTPDSPVDYVLEVNSGFVKQHGITIGDQVDLSKATAKE